MTGKSTRESGPVVEADLEDYLKITLPRRRLARWCKEPFFEQAIVSCFVRLLIGDHDGKKCYRLCQISKVMKGKKSYSFPPANPNEKPVSAGVRSLPQFARGPNTRPPSDKHKQVAGSQVRKPREGVPHVSYF